MGAQQKSVTHRRTRPASTTSGVALRQPAGQRLRRGFRAAGGEEFTIEILGRIDRTSAEHLAAQIEAILAAPFEATGEGQEATVGISLRAIDGDPRPVWAEAMRGADTEAPRRGLRCWIADGSA